jgi:hypothetical protein
MQTCLTATQSRGPGQCKNPVSCGEMARQHAAYLNTVLPGAIDLHTQFLAYGQHEVAVAEEASRQMFALGTARRDVIDILECCEPIAATFGAASGYLGRLYACDGAGMTGRGARQLVVATVEFLKYTLVLAGETRRDRPVHIVCRFWDRPPAGKAWAMTIVAVYAPSVYRWSDGFTRRTCFCDVTSRIEDGIPALA